MVGCVRWALGHTNVFDRMTCARRQWRRVSSAGRRSGHDNVVRASIALNIRRRCSVTRVHIAAARTSAARRWQAAPVRASPPSPAPAAASARPFAGGICTVLRECAYLGRRRRPRSGATRRWWSLSRSAATCRRARRLLGGRRPTRVCRLSSADCRFRPATPSSATSPAHAPTTTRVLSLLSAYYGNKVTPWLLVVLRPGRTHNAPRFLVLCLFPPLAAGLFCPCALWLRAPAW